MLQQEIERKFLVNGEFKIYASTQHKIEQGYLSTNPERTVRIRIADEKAFITIKGKSNKAGTSRLEWEKEITVEEAKKLISICEPGVIAKTRYHIKAGSHMFEVDEFYGENKGLVIAEIELQSEDEAFIKPDWLGKEVTGDAKYYNASLIKNPFKNW